MKWDLKKLMLLAITSTLLVWLPFVLKTKLPLWDIDFSKGMFTVFANFDGPNYLIVAKSWYDKTFIRLNFSAPIPLEYYPAHLPFYPALIRLADLVLPGPVAMLLVTLAGTLAALTMFYVYLKEFKLTKDPLFLTTVFLFLPARFLIVRTVGSPEPWFIFFVLATLYFYKKGKYLWAGIFGALAQLTKSPAILLFASLCLYHCYLNWGKSFIQKSAKDVTKIWPLLLIPISAIGLFFFYQLRTGDFLAYFHSGDNFHLFWPPFSIFSPKGQFWVGEFWLEDVIYIWLVFGVGLGKLWQKNLKLEAFFAGVFYASTLFVAHRDISRYILPIAPLVLIGYEKLATQPMFKKLFYLLLIPVFLYSWNFILHNIAPIADWTPYL
jgi:hypothetical protein